AGHPAALYALLRSRACAGYGALIFTGARWILSFSPELFFTFDATGLTAKPMKGTARRGATAAEDDALAAHLAADIK
ncbi:chorismate-binding protein, partial [Acinetobacter nosocomialis]|uniref:chorismate-binding protein n=4 Tax=Pseudomonadota TaxID=1224 RepID=UPI0014901B3D